MAFTATWESFSTGIRILSFWVGGSWRSAELLDSECIAYKMLVKAQGWARNGCSGTRLELIQDNIITLWTCGIPTSHSWAVLTRQSFSALTSRKLSLTQKTPKYPVLSASSVVSLVRGFQSWFSS